jgi:hypothetical protein
MDSSAAFLKVKEDMDGMLQRKKADKERMQLELEKIGLDIDNVSGLTVEIDKIIEDLDAARKADQAAASDLDVVCAAWEKAKDAKKASALSLVAVVERMKNVQDKTSQFNIAATSSIYITAADKEIQHEDKEIAHEDKELGHEDKEIGHEEMVDVENTGQFRFLQCHSMLAYFLFTLFVVLLCRRRFSCRYEEA